jgi:hypothetical protein
MRSESQPNASPLYLPSLPLVSLHKQAKKTQTGRDDGALRYRKTRHDGERWQQAQTRAKAKLETEKRKKSG